MTSFDLEEERLKREIDKRKAKTVLLQLPEGLKAEGPRIAAIIENVGALAIVSADPCYGACDLFLSDAESLGVDLILHYGHSPKIIQERVATVYIDARARISVRETVKKAIPLLESWINIGLVTTVQHVHKLHEMKDLLVKAGKTVVIGDAGRVKYPGQVLGCDYSNAKSISKEVDAFLFVGGGRFHAIGVAIATLKPTVLSDPYEKRAYFIHDEVERILKQRWASISEAREAERLGVLISLKTGQKKVKASLKIKDRLQRSGRKVTLFALREITPEALLQFPTVEAFVNTACPRLSLEDSFRFLKPILTFNETLVALGEMEWEELCRRGWFEGET